MALTVEVRLEDVTGVTDDASRSSDMGVTALRLGVGSADGTVIGLITFKINHQHMELFACNFSKQSEGKYNVTGVEALRSVSTACLCATDVRCTEITDRTLSPILTRADISAGPRGTRDFTYIPPCFTLVFIPPCKQPMQIFL